MFRLLLFSEDIDLAVYVLGLINDEVVLVNHTAVTIAARCLRNVTLGRETVTGPTTGFSSAHLDPAWAVIVPDDQAVLVDPGVFARLFRKGEIAVAIDISAR